MAVFLRRWLIYPLTVAADGGGYFLMSLEVIPGHDVRKTEYIAVQMVDNSGLYSVTWRNTMRCTIVIRGGVYAA